MDNSTQDCTQNEIERLREALAEQDQRHRADKDEERDLVGKRREVRARQRADRSFAVAGDEDEKGDEEAGQQKPQQALAH